MDRKSLPRVWLFRILLSLFVLILLAVCVGVFYLKKELSAERVSAELNSQLQSRGLLAEIQDFRFTWTGNFELTGVCIRNTKLVSRLCLAAAERITLDLKLIPLFKKKVVVQGVDVLRPEFHFFEEDGIYQGKKVRVQSWKIETPAASQNKIAEGLPVASDFKIQNIRLFDAKLFHDVRVLPWPVGLTTFSLKILAEGRSIEFQAARGEKSSLQINLKPRFENLEEVASNLIDRKPWNPSDTFSGHGQFKDWDLNAWISSARGLSGKLRFECRNSQLEIVSEGAQIATKIAHASEIDWQGSAVLSLPQMQLKDGKGSVKIPAGSGTYESLHEGAQGYSVDFSGSVALAPFTKNSVEGILALQGTLRNSQVNASFSAQNVLVKKSPVKIEAARLSGQWSGAHIVLAKQELSVGGHGVKASLSLDVGKTVPKIRGEVESGVLDLEKMFPKHTESSTELAGEKSAASSSTTSSTAIEMDLKLKGAGLLFRGVKSQAWRAVLKMNSSMTALQDFYFAVGRGSLRGSWSEDTKHRQTLSFHATGIEAQYLKPLFNTKATVYGPITAHGNLTFSGKSLSSVIASGVGEMSLKLGRGKVKDSFFQKGILTGPLHKLEQKFTDVEFASLSVETRVKNGKALIDKVFLDAEEFQINLRAEANSDAVGKAALHFRFKASFIENVANPLYLGITERKDGEFYDLPFACRGKVLESECYAKNW